MYINNKICDVQLGNTDHCGNVEVFEMGKTLSGRVARVSRHWLPIGFIEDGCGAIKTGGNVYSFKAREKQ